MKSTWRFSFSDVIKVDDKKIKNKFCNIFHPKQHFHGISRTNFSREKVFEPKNTFLVGYQYTEGNYLVFPSHPFSEFTFYFRLWFWDYSSRKYEKQDPYGFFPSLKIQKAWGFFISACFISTRDGWGRGEWGDRSVNEVVR